MKQTRVETEKGGTKIKQSDCLPKPPPPPPPLPKFGVQRTITKSVTNQEIAKFWRQKRIEEEDHLLAAIKAAARIRARNMTEDLYKQFVESLTDDNTNENTEIATIDGAKEEKNSEIRIGIKDWWTKSKYAYLNEPAIESMDPPKRRTSNYTPNCFSFMATPLYPTSPGIF